MPHPRVPAGRLLRAGAGRRRPTCPDHPTASRYPPRAIGFALGGEAGSRLSERLALPTSPDTILRRVKAAPAPAHPTPRVLGVDDFAFRRGQTYGTILVDLERRCVVDLLPDRTAVAVADWLRTHPGVEVVSRDRASAYAQAAAAAAPQAAQVADRFHLLTNVREAGERVLARHATAVRDALADPPAAGPRTPPPVEDPEPPHRRREREEVAGRRAARRARYERARELRDQGYSVRRIARALRMSPGTILRYLRAGHVADWRPGRPSLGRLDPYRGYLDEQLAAGLATPGCGTGRCKPGGIPAGTTRSGGRSAGGPG